MITFYLIMSYYKIIKHTDRDLLQDDKTKGS